MELFLLYLWTRLDPIILLSSLSLLVLLCVAFYSGTVYMYNKNMDKCYKNTEEDKGEYKIEMITNKTLFEKTLSWASIPLLILLLIPSQKDAAIIAGGWLVKEVATSESVNTISKKTFDLINGKLDEQLEALKPPKTP